MNPEFTRNCWLELNGSKLYLLPLCLFVFFLASHLLKFGHLFEQAKFLATLSICVWATRSTESVVGEVINRTWDNQRMCLLGPWGMTWGKLLGSTIYQWYAFALCLVLMLIKTKAPLPQLFYYDVLPIVLAGIFAQSSAFFFALLTYQSNPESKRGSSLLIPIVSVLLTFSYFSPTIWGQDISLTTLTWYGRHYSLFNFCILSQLAFIGWLILGNYRLMCHELQVPTTPWAWIGFQLFVLFYAFGFLFTDILKDVPFLIPCIFGFFMTCNATVVTAFVEPKNVISLRKWLVSIERKDYLHALQTMPLWLMTAFLAVIFGFLCILFSDGARIDAALAELNIPFNSSISSIINVRYITPAVIALLSFAARDIGVIYSVNLNPNYKRPMLVSFVYLTLLYTLIPWIIHSFDVNKTLSSIVAPWVWLHPNLPIQAMVVGLSGLLLQTVIIWMIAKNRWDQLYFHKSQL